MRSRRSHLKSRRGCLICKKRRVKCDESGPPCGACKLRATTCEYASPEPTLQRSPSHDHAANTEVTHVWQTSEQLFPLDTHLLELQLMHRWSTVTYKSAVAKVAEDDYVWQTKLPDLSIRYEFLLHGIFALAAFEIASSTDCDRVQYISAAVRYQTLALGSFRKQLNNMSASNHEPVLIFSLMLMVLALASPQFIENPTNGEQDSVLQTTLTHFELVRGCGVVLESQANFVMDNPYIQKLKQLSELPRVQLQPEIEEVLSNLNEANDRRVTSSVGESYQRRIKQVSYWEACKKACASLKECYEKCYDNDYSGYILGWVNIAGEEYVEALKARDEVALLILLYWGVLVEKLSHLAWWMKKFGSMLVEEVGNDLLSEEIDILSKDLILQAQSMIETTRKDETLSSTRPG